MKSSSKGFTLVELIVAVVIASILARIGFVTYTSYILRANRAVARATLVNLAAKQEVQLMQNGSYAATFQNLNGISGTSFSINQNGAINSATDSSAIYLVSFSTIPTATSPQYAFTAQSSGSQLRDTACTAFILNSSGLRQAQNSGGLVSDPTTCWEK